MIQIDRAFERPEMVAMDSSSTQIDSTPPISKKNSLEQLEAATEVIVSKSWAKRVIDRVNLKARYPRVYNVLTYARGPSPPRSLECGWKEIIFFYFC